MVPFPVHLSALLDLSVVLLQIFGVLALAVCRLHSSAHWVDRGKLGLVIALVGLGVAGALCGQHDSEFALFAGLTMTALLIGLTVGNPRPASATGRAGLWVAPGTSGGR
ncbi:hypothetical protein BH23PLA1_BH23PLA1_15160 [soil metagenome]